MRILHLCLASFYIDGYSYQENILPRINKEDGHEVMIIASTETYIDNARLGYLQPREYYTEYGVRIKRLEYCKVVNDFISHKLRKYIHLYEEIQSFNPDVIMSHGLAYLSVKDVVRYKKEHPNIKIYADTHTAYYNSGTNWISKYILHDILYGYSHRIIIPYLEKYFYIGESERQFCIREYNVPEEIMEYYPLGGIILTREEYERKRAVIREGLNVRSEEHLYMHSGKMNSSKKTEELLRAFSAVDDSRAKLVIIGSIDKSIYPNIISLIENDERIQYIGWKSGEELQEYLCAADVYCQPGSVSATLQSAICNNCAIVSYPHETYKKYFNNGCIYWISSEEDMKEVFSKIRDNLEIVEIMKLRAETLAKEMLDYRKLASRLYY